MFHQNPQGTGRLDSYALMDNSGMGTKNRGKKLFVRLGEKEPYNRDAQYKCVPSRGARKKIKEDSQFSSL